MEKNGKRKKEMKISWFEIFKEGWYFEGSGLIIYCGYDLNITGIHVDNFSLFALVVKNVAEFLRYGRGVGEGYGAAVWGPDRARPTQPLHLYSTT